MIVKGFRVAVNVPNFDEYLKAFLAIYNTYKSNFEFVRFGNDYGSNIFVWCLPEHLPAVIEYLENFGEVTVIDEYLFPIVPNYSDAEYDLFPVPYIDE